MSLPGFVSIGTVFNESMSEHPSTKSCQLSGSGLFSAGGIATWQHNIALIAELPPKQATEPTWIQSKVDNDLLRVYFVRELSSPRTVFDTPDYKKSHVKQSYPASFGIASYYSSEKAQPLSAPKKNYPNIDLLTIEKLFTTLSSTIPFHIGTMLHEKQVYLCSALDRKNARLVTLNPSSQMLQPAHLSRLVNHITNILAIFPHITQIQNLFRNHQFQLWEQMAYLASFGPKIVVVRNEPHQYWVYDRVSDLRWEVPWYPIENPKLVGCGNAFGGGFSAGYALTSDPVLATLYGAISASFAAQSHSPIDLFETYHPLAQARLAKLTQFVQPA